MPYPIDDLTNAELDTELKDASIARAELNNAILKIKAMIAATGVGVSEALKLDSNGKIPSGVVFADSSVAGALFTISAGFVLPSAGITYMPFDTVVYDDFGVHNPALPTRVTVPPGITRARVTTTIDFGFPVASQYTVNLFKSRIQTPGLPNIQKTTTALGPVLFSFSSATIKVANTEYFELRVAQSTGADITLPNNGTTFVGVDFY